MKVRVLVDNSTFIDQYYLGEPAFCLYIENEGDKILLDMGYSDVFIKNAVKMGIDLTKVNKIVFSHGHNDHTGGIVAFDQRFGLKGIEIIAHPECFDSRKDQDLEVGSPYSKEELTQKGALLKLTRTPVEISPNLFYLGEIKEWVQERSCVGIKAGQPDHVMDDSGLVYRGKKGLWIFSGCAHSGIDNIIAQAKQWTQEEKIAGVLGGFHLLQSDSRLKKTIDYLKSLNCPRFYPCHCVSLHSKIEMAKEMQIFEVGVGLKLEI